MPGDVLGSDIGTMYYIRSDAAFNIARARGLWEVLLRRVARRNPHLASFRASVADSDLADARYIGVQTVATSEITGSLGRHREFSSSFLPVGNTARLRERWRQSYTRLLAGETCPPVRLCRVGDRYYVVNGHHRVSAARYLNLEAVQAHVSEIDLGTTFGNDGEFA